MTDKDRVIDKERDRVLVEQVLLAYRQTPIAIISSFVLTALTVWITHGTLPTHYQVIWSCIIIISGLARLIALKKTQTIIFDYDKAKSYVWFHIITTTVSGIAWGTIALSLPILSPQQQVLILIILAGLIGGATVASVALPASYLGFVLPVMLLSNVAAIITGGTFGYILVVAFTSYTIFLIFSGWRIHQTILSNMRMRLHQENLNKQITKERLRFEQVLGASPTGTLLADSNGTIMYVNQELCRLFGYTSQELDGQTVELLVPEEYRKRHKIHRKQLTNADKIRKMGLGQTLSGQHKDGSTFPVEIGLQSITLLDEELQIATIMDLSKQVKLQEKIQGQADLLEKLSLTDELTGLGNRRAFNNKIKEYVELSLRGSMPVSLMLLDIDYFKKYNDSFGHMEGDEALRQVASIMDQQSRGVDFVARYGGEEFAIIMPDTDRDQAFFSAKRIRAAVESYPWALRPLTISIGISTTHELKGNPIQSNEAVDSLINRADEALYQSKANGRNRVTISE